MQGDKALSRRKVVKIAGGATSMALVAGCGGNGNGNGDNGNGNGDVDTAEWEGVSEIELGGEIAGWQGEAPDMISGSTNPTLVFFEGEDYTITWENLDGSPHNVEILDDAGEVIEGTETMQTQGETQTFEFTATAEMVEYQCRPHSNQMYGDVIVE